jgi:hypothetical protein
LPGRRGGPHPFIDEDVFVDVPAIGPGEAERIFLSP